MVILFFFNTLLFVGILIGLIILSEKVASISKTVDYLTKTISKLQANNTQTEPQKPVEKIIPEKINQPVKPEVIIKSEADITPEKTITTPPKYIEVNNEKIDFELQNVFLGNIFNKIGAIAIIIAVVIFIKLISPFITITPLMKIMFSFFAGFAMIGSAFYMHKKDNLKNYSEVLLGTGFATLFITSFCGYSMFNLYNTGTAISIGALLLLATFVISEQMKTPSMLVIGLIGGYLTPIFSGTTYEASMWYLIFLNLVSIVYTLRNQSYSYINIINLIITMFAFMPYVIEPLKVTYPLVLWGIYLLYDIVRDKSSKTGYSLSIINYAVLTIFSILLFHNAHTSLGYLFGITAFIYAGMAVYSYILKTKLYKTYVHYILLNAWFGIFFLLNDISSVIFWSVIAFILAVLVSKFKQKYLTGSVILFCSTAFAGALLAKYNGDFCIFADYTPILNFRTLVFGVPILSILGSGFLLKNSDKETFNLLTFGGISLAYLYIVGELNSIIADNTLDKNYIQVNKCLIYTIIGFIYALQTQKLYQQTKYVLFNIASWIIFPITMFTLLLNTYDYHIQNGYMPVINIRTAAYLTAITTSIIFSKWYKTDFFKYLAVFLGLFLIHFESIGIVYISGNFNYLISLAWVLYSGGITIYGILSNKRYLINSGIFMIILTIFRIFIYDLAKVEPLYKLIAFLALGIILMLVSYIYTSRKNSSK